MKASLTERVLSAFVGTWIARFIRSAIFMLVWNYFRPEEFHLAPISYWAAFWLCYVAEYCSNLSREISLEVRRQAEE